MMPFVVIPMLQEDIGSDSSIFTIQLSMPTITGKHEKDEKVFSHYIKETFAIYVKLT